MMYRLHKKNYKVKAAGVTYLQFFQEEVPRSCKGPFRFVPLDTPPVMGCASYVCQFTSN
jgi:hypothetical protein